MRALVVIALVLMLSLTWSVAQYSLQSELTEAVPCGDQEMEDKLRAMILEALDASFKDQVKNTLSVWMRDDRDQPRRAANGIRGAANAYLRTRKALTKWKLRPC